MSKPENGIGWTPDRFRLRLWWPNCGLRGAPYTDPQVYTWEQATERVRRLMDEGGDPLLSVEFVTVDPLDAGA